MLCDISPCHVANKTVVPTTAMSWYPTSTSANHSWGAEFWSCLVSSIRFYRNDHLCFGFHWKAGHTNDSTCYLHDLHFLSSLSGIFQVCCVTAIYIYNIHGFLHFTFHDKNLVSRLLQKFIVTLKWTRYEKLNIFQIKTYNSRVWKAKLNLKTDSQLENLQEI